MALEHIPAGHYLVKGKPVPLARDFVASGPISPEPGNEADQAALREMLRTYQGSWGAGPLVLEYTIDLPGLTAKGRVLLSGMEIGSFELRPDEQRITIGGSVDGFKAELTITLNFDPFRMTVKGELAAPFVDSAKYDEVFTFS